MTWGLGISRLEHDRGLHEILDVLAKDGVFGTEFQVLLLDGINSSGEILQSVLKFQDLEMRRKRDVELRGGVALGI